MATSPIFAGGKCVHASMLMQTEEMNAFLLFILKSKTKACVLKGNVCIWTIDQIQYLSLHRVVGIGYLYWKKKRKHSLLLQLFKYPSKRGFFFFFALESLKWCGIFGAVSLTQYKLNLFAPTLFITWHVIPGWRVAHLLFCKPLHYHSC